MPLSSYLTNPGLAPFGLRNSGDSAKGKGFFGMLQRPDGGFSSELSAENGAGEFPLIVPTLTREELNQLLSGAPPTDVIYRKAQAHAAERMQKGLNPFAQDNELRYPMPGSLEALQR